MATLRVIIDQLVAPVPGGIGRYTLELTRQLIATAPRNCDVEGTMPSPDDPMIPCCHAADSSRRARVIG